MRATFLVVSSLLASFGCHSGTRESTSSPRGGDALPIVAIYPAMCHDQPSPEPRVITSPEALVEATGCADAAEQGAPSVDWSTQWVYLAQYDPFATMTKVRERGDVVVVELQRTCPGGAPEPPAYVSLALSRPVRPVRVEYEPHGGECPMLP